MPFQGKQTDTCCFLFLDKSAGKTRPGLTWKELTWLRDKVKIIFLGDSITDADHNLYPGNPGEPCLGDGYVRQIADILRMRMPGRTDIRNGGHDGFTVQGLLRMLEHDCLSRRPDVVSVLIGSNDAAVCMNTGRTLEETYFAENYRALLGRVRGATEGCLVCMGPFIFPQPLEYSRWIPVIQEIEETERKIAAEHRALFIPLHNLLNREAERSGYQRLTADGIHLTREGAEIVARAWIQETDRAGMFI